jgi:hypothetical protein
MRHKKKVIALSIIFTLIAATFLILPTNFSADVESYELIDEVNIGDTTSEYNHDLVGWGPIEPATHGGGWGGAAFGILTTGDTDLRTVWAPSIGDNDPSASLKLSTGGFMGTVLRIISLDGSADDSFEVYIDGELSFYYNSDPSTSEFWVIHDIPVMIESDRTVTITIKSIGTAWSGINAWGQLGISYIGIYGYEAGFNEYGYNYNAHMFRGYYANAYLHGEDLPPYQGDTEAYLAEHPEAASKWYWPYRDIMLMMKWSDVWLSNQDRNADGKLDRGNEEPYLNSAAEGAWLTNHMRGVDDNGKKWNYFTKIAYPSVGVVDVNPADGMDDITGAPIIWGGFIIMKDVDSGAGSINYCNPQGWGAI